MPTIPFPLYRNLVVDLEATRRVPSFLSILPLASHVLLEQPRISCDAEKEVEIVFGSDLRVITGMRGWNREFYLIFISLSEKTYVVVDHWRWFAFV